MFDWEHSIALNAMQGKRASSPGEGEVSYVFLCCGKNLRYILELRQGWPFETEFVQQSQDSCLAMTDSSGI